MGPPAAGPRGTWLPVDGRPVPPPVLPVTACGVTPVPSPLALSLFICKSCPSRKVEVKYTPEEIHARLCAKNHSMSQNKRD